MKVAAVDGVTGIGLRFVQQWDIKADYSPIRVWTYFGCAVWEIDGLTFIDIDVWPCFAPVGGIDHHDHKPFWSRSMLLGGFIASGGWW